VVTDDASPGDGLDLESVPDSARLAAPRPVPVRLDDLEREGAKTSRSIKGLHREIDEAKDRFAWGTVRVVVAILGGALGMVITVIGAAWVLSARIAEQGEAIRAVGDRVERVEARIDRIEERQWLGSRPEGEP
jgi:hypothetical protein